MRSGRRSAAPPYRSEGVYGRHASLWPSVSLTRIERVVSELLCVAAAAPSAALVHHACTANWRHASADSLRPDLFTVMTTRNGLTRTPSLGCIPMSVGSLSTCGNQAKSTFKSNPAFSFGTSSRETAQKRFISDEHKSKELPKGTPGAGQYNHRVTIGKQPITGQKTTPSYGFGTSARFDKTKDAKAAAVPGPGAYMV